MFFPPTWCTYLSYMSLDSSQAKKRMVRRARGENNGDDDEQEASPRRQRLELRTELTTLQNELAELKKRLSNPKEPWEEAVLKH